MRWTILWYLAVAKHLTKLKTRWEVGHFVGCLDIGLFKELVVELLMSKGHRKRNDLHQSLFCVV